MATQNGTGKAQKMKAVIELFTSQGCSSCPPADKLLESYIKRKDVIALTMPVDYWDYLGWKDTLASPHYSARQRSYARSRGDRNVYTPQIVINGTTHAIGSDRQAINRLIKVTNARLSPQYIGVKMWTKGDTLMVQTQQAPKGMRPTKGTIWLALVKKSQEVKVKRGENGGRNLVYHNVVRELTPVGKWSSDKTVTLTLPKDPLMGRGSDGCTILLQEGETGPILGAAEIKSW